jgi:DNA-directed RNA polymerase subunit RPC12/RpoP
MRPGNRYDRDPGLRRTLGELADATMALVAVCRRCKHRRVLYTANLIARFGGNYRAIELRERLRCSNCRGRAVNLHESSR